MASTVTVTLTDQAGGVTKTAEIPTDVPMSRLVPALVTKLGLPSGSYALQHKQSGKQLQASDTLKSAGVKENDTLRLLPNVVAGKS